MKFRFLGTAAAEGIPASFCACERCQQARLDGGRSLRGRSQAIIDNRLLIDLPADTGYRSIFGQLDLPAIRHCLITHSHQDHFYPEELLTRQVGFAHPTDDIPLTIYGTTETLHPLHREPFREMILQGRLACCEVRPFLPFNANNYTIVAFPANHGPNGSVFYQISDGDVTILYAHDTGYFNDEIWEWLANNRPSYRFISLDCTGGAATEGWHDGHMSLPGCSEMRQHLEELGCLAPQARQFVNHFTHNTVGMHQQLCEEAAAYQFEVAYDGCELVI